MYLSASNDLTASVKAQISAAFSTQVYPSDGNIVVDSPDLALLKPSVNDRFQRPCRIHSAGRV